MTDDIILFPVQSGSIHNFDTGNPTMNDVNEDTVYTSDAVDNYTTPAIESGVFQILAIQITASCRRTPKE